MRDIRPVSESELDDLVAISARAYPGFDLLSEAEGRRYREHIAQVRAANETQFVALFEDNEMRGVMRWYDFTINLFGSQVLAGGVGGVAVDLLHKKEGIAADMMRAFLAHYHDQGACLTTLYPFRPDFYRRMGFGYGTPLYSYHIKPANLPLAEAGHAAAYLTSEDTPALEDCYSRNQQQTHGLMVRHPGFWERLFRNPANQVIGLWQGKRLSGYLIFRFEKGETEHFLNNNVFVREMLADTPGDLRRLLSFLRLQADQIETIIVNSPDPTFFYQLQDPRHPSGNLLPHVVAHESGRQGLGLMLRIINVRRLFGLLADHDFGGQSLQLAITLTDSFFPRNAGTTAVTFTNGRAQVSNGPAEEGIAMHLDVADFSSLVLGCISARSLAQWGLLRLSDDDALDRIDQLFRAPAPICLTSF